MRPTTHPLVPTKVCNHSEESFSWQGVLGCVDDAEVRAIQTKRMNVWTDMQV